MLKRFIDSGLFKVLVATTIVALIAVFLGDSLRELKGAPLQIVIIAVAVIILNFIFAVYGYLRESLPTEIEKYQKEVRLPEKETKDNGKTVVVVTESEQEQEDPTIELCKEKKASEYSYPDEISLKRRDIINIFGETEKRIRLEIGSLNKRANINLIIGGFVALFGIGTLVAFLLTVQDSSSGDGLALLIVRWVARLSLVSLVELFAFFFLKIYKTELLSIQYYQDELTSIESRKIALLFSVIHDCQEDVSKSIDCLVNIDRNFKMNTTQTTVELEKLKTENSFIKSQMDSMIDIFKGALSFIPKKQE